MKPYAKRDPEPLRTKKELLLREMKLRLLGRGSEVLTHSKSAWDNLKDPMCDMFRPGDYLSSNFMRWDCPVCLLSAGHYK